VVVAVVVLEEEAEVVEEGVVHQGEAEEDSADSEALQEVPHAAEEDGDQEANRLTSD
jgi:rRNA maturation endonuclease Nob1